MFSGIVSGQGVVVKIQTLPRHIRVGIRHQGLGKCVRTGDSVAVNGCCLTVITNRAKTFQFDVLKETWKRTVLQHAHVGEKVNLESSLCLGDPIGGHLVTGHVDGIGRITRRRQNKGDVFLEITPPSRFMCWVVMKGSVAVDGVSLTVAHVDKFRLGVWVIPHTLRLATLGWKQAGDFVNLEGDLFAKYAQKALTRQRP